MVRYPEGNPQRMAGHALREAVDRSTAAASGLPQRYDRCGVGGDRPPVACSQGTWPAPPPLAAGDHQRHSVRPARRHRWARPAARLPAVADGLDLLSAVAGQWHLEAGPRRPVPARPDGQGTGPRAQRWRPGQPVGQDDGKRGTRGYDAGKKVKGRKRFLLVDTAGWLVGLWVDRADTQDRDGGPLVVQQAYQEHPRLGHLWVDTAFAGEVADWVRR